MDDEFRFRLRTDEKSRVAKVNEQTPGFQRNKSAYSTESDEGNTPTHILSNRMTPYQSNTRTGSPDKKTKLIIQAKIAPRQNPEKSNEKKSRESSLENAMSG